MEELVKRLNFIDLKPYITSSRSCKLGNTCLMEAKYGMLTVSLNAFSLSRCVFLVKRVSGNGKILVVSGESSIEIDVQSKVSQSISIDIGNNKEIQLKRSHRSTGEIEITEVLLYEQSAIEEEDMDWGKILNSCKSKGVKIVGNKLIASEGAYIITDKVNNIVTEPINTFKIENNKIRFLYNCEILKLDINKKNKDIFASLQQSSPLDITVQPRTKSIATMPMAQRLVKGSILDSSDTSSNLVYDSSLAGLNNVICNEHVEVSKTLSLDHLGLVKINLPVLKQNTDYIVLVEANKVNGNGKIKVSINPSNARPLIHLLSPINSIVNFNVSSGIGANFQLEIERPPAATGKIVVSRVLILTSLVSFSFPQIGMTSSNPNVNDNSVETISKSFCNLYEESYAPLELFNVKGIIEPLTYSSNLWVNKVLPYFPNIYVKSNSSYKRTGDKSDLVIGELNKLAEAKNIWIEEFINKQLNDSDVNILNKSNKIFSSSLPNVQYLRKTFGEKIEYVPKIWPYVKPKEYIKNNNYILYFNRSNHITNDLLRFVSSEMVIIGARGSYPPNFIPIGSYLPYDNLMSLILNAGCVLDLPENNHYMSGLLDLCFIAGIPIVTTNHWMSIAKPKQFHLRSVLNGDVLHPKLDELPVLLNQALSVKKKGAFDMSSYNKNLYSLVKTIMDVS